MKNPIRKSLLPAGSAAASVLTLALLGLGVEAAVVEVTPANPWVKWDVAAGGNGHWYRAIRVTTPVSWAEAHTNSSSLGGYLASITSAEENVFVFSLVSSPDCFNGEYGALFGGYQPSGAPEPGGGWTWVSGEPWAYSNWAGSQPDNGGGGGSEGVPHFWSGPSWNDVPQDAAQFVSFVIERDTEPPVAIYDASKDFSLAFNPNGVWSYGWKSTLGGAFTLLPHARTASFDNGVPALTWELASMQHPEVVCNATTNTGISDGGQGQYSPGTLFMTAGFDGRPENFGVIRFTAPAPGTYLIESASRSHLDGDRSGDTDYHVVVDGVEVFAQFLPPRSETGFTNTLTLDAGGTVDLMVGRGADGRLYGSGLKIQATLTGPPNVLQPPTIMTHPQSQEVIAGTNVTLTVSASGSLPMAFQWQLNGTNLDGAISSTLLLTDVQPDMAGVYTVVVTNPSGSVTSDPATLTVLVPPQITLAPQGQDGYWGKSATFMVRAVGTLPLEYAWFKDGFPIDWATNSALVLTNLEMSAGGDYWVTVCNRGGCLTSAPARLVMNPAGVSMGLYPGITIEGVVGKRYGIQYTTNISSTTSWTTVTNFTLVQPVQMWVDTSAEAKSVNYPKRFYRVVPVP